MLIPTKYENLNNNCFVIGSEIISIIKKNSSSVDNCFFELQKTRKIDLEKYFECLLFLYMVDILELKDNYIFLRR